MNHIKSAFEKINEVRALVRERKNDQAITIAKELLQADYIPFFSRRYLEHVIKTTKNDAYYDWLKNIYKADSNESFSIIKEILHKNLTKSNHGLVRNHYTLVGNLKIHGIRLIRIFASPSGKIDFVAISCQDFHRIKFCLHQNNNRIVCSEAALTRLSPTSQEIKVAFNQIDISNEWDVEVQYSLPSSPKKTISTRSSFINLKSFCPVALACSSAKMPKYQDVSLINYYLLRHELAIRSTDRREDLALSHEEGQLYCVDISDSSFTIINLLATVPLPCENLDISMLESVISELDPGSILLLKDFSILLREDIAQVAMTLVANGRQSLHTKAVLLDHLIKDVDSNALFFTNYETIEGLPQISIPKTNVLVKSCLITIDLFLDTARKVMTHKKSTADQCNASSISLIIDTLIESNNVCFSFEGLIGIQYLPCFPAEQKRLFQQSPHTPLQVSCNQEYLRAQPKDIGILRLTRMNCEHIEQFEHQHGSKIIDLEEFLQSRCQDPITEYTGLHHGEIILDVSKLTKAIVLSGVGYVSFIHPEFNLGYSKYFQDLVALIQKCPLGISVSPHIYERKSQTSNVTKIILGETFEHLQASDVRISPDSFPTRIAEGQIPIQVPTLIGSLFDSEHFLRAMSDQHLCSTRDMQALLSVEAYKNGYQQILSSSFVALYTSPMPYKLFNIISEDVSRKVRLSGVTMNLPLVSTSFKAMHD